MSDPRIVDYLKQNQGKYPVEALKAALVKQGFPPADVEAAAREAAGEAPAAVPPPPGAAPAPDAPAVVLSPGRAFSNAKAMFSAPLEHFAGLDPEAPFGGAVATIAVWAFISGVASFLLAFLHPSPFGVIASALQIVMMPVMGVILSWVGAGIFHVVCLILGGNASYRTSYQVIASMAALFPVSTVLSIIPFGTIPVQLAGLWLSVNAADAAQKVPRGRAWAAFGVLTAFGVLGSIMAQAGLRQMERNARSLPGLTAPAEPGQFPQGIPADAAQALGALGGQMTPEAQKAMQDAMQNPAAILQELTRYGNLNEPPAETLALLDGPAKARLMKSWPALSAPMRKSLVETLPSVPSEERAKFMDQMDSYTKDMNATINQSMKLIEQAQKQLEQSGSGRR